MGGDNSDVVGDYDDSQSIQYEDSMQTCGISRLVMLMTIMVVMMLKVAMLMVSMRIVRVCRPGGYPGWSAQC